MGGPGNKLPVHEAWRCRGLGCTAAMATCLPGVPEECCTLSSILTVMENDYLLPTMPPPLRSKSSLPFPLGHGVGGRESLWEWAFVAVVLVIPPAACAHRLGWLRAIDCTFIDQQLMEIVGRANNQRLWMGLEDAKRLPERVYNFLPL